MATGEGLHVSTDAAARIGDVVRTVEAQGRAERGPESRASATTGPEKWRLGVVRSVGSEVDHFILVQWLIQIIEEPGWKFSAQPAERVGLWPGILSGLYKVFVSTWDSAWIPNVGIRTIECDRGRLSWIAKPWTVMATKSMDEVELPVTDLFAPQPEP